MTDSRLLRLLVTNGSAGVLGALAFVGCLLVFDVAGIGRLARGAESAWWMLLLLCSGTAVTFGSVAMGIGVMTLGEDRDRPD